MIDIALLSDQQRRVLVAARQGPIRQQDFDLPHVIDGMRPIKRVAARVGELKHEFGCEWSKSMVSASRAPDAALVAEYTLLSEPSARPVPQSCPSVPHSSAGQHEPAPVHPPLSLGQAPSSPRHALDDDWDWRAA